MGTRRTTILTLITGLVVGLISISAIGGGPSGEQIMDRFTLKDNLDLLVYGIEGDWKNPDACDSTEYAVLLPDESPEGAEKYNEQYAAILGAHLTRRSVNFRFSGCQSIKDETYPIISQVTVN